MTNVWNPINVGSLQLPHRLATAPITRSRAKPDGTYSDLAAQYYAQRASMSLLRTEGTQPSDDEQGYVATPGVYTDACRWLAQGRRCCPFRRRAPVRATDTCGTQVAPGEHAASSAAACPFGHRAR